MEPILGNYIRWDPKGNEEDSEEFDELEEEQVLKMSKYNEK